MKVYVIIEHEKEKIHIRGVYFLYEHAREIVDCLFYKEQSRGVISIKEYSMNQVYKGLD